MVDPKAFAKAIRIRDDRQIGLAILDIAATAVSRLRGLQRADREEITSEVTLHLLEILSRGNVRPDENPWSYLTSCALRHAKKLATRITSTAQPSELLPDDPAPIPSPPEVAANRETAHAIQWRTKKHGLRRLAHALADPSNQSKAGRIIAARVARATGKGSRGRDISRDLRRLQHHLSPVRPGPE